MDSFRCAQKRHKLDSAHGAVKRARARVAALVSIIATLMLPTLASPTATAYYVSSSTGDDTNDGLSPATAWRSLVRASAVAPILTPGAALLLRAGDVWTVDATWTMNGISGTEATPAMISAYGSSAEARPRIVRGPGVPPRGPTLAISNSRGVAVHGLEFVGGENGVAFLHDLPGTYGGFAIVDCVFHRIRGLNYNASTGDWWGSAVAIAAARAGVTVTNVNITNNVCNASDTFYQNSMPGMTRSFVAGLTIAANTVTYASYNTVFLDTTAFVSVHQNVFARDSPQALFVAGTTDIIMGTLNASVTLKDNEVSFRGEYSPGGPDGCAVDFETHADGVAFVNNFVYRAFAAGVMVFGHGSPSVRLRLENNTMLYNGCGQTRDDRGGIAFMFVNSTGRIAGNIFATCDGTPLFYERVPNASAGWEFTNNTIDGKNGAVVTALAPPRVESAVNSVGNLTFTALCPDTPSQLRFTIDGSRPMADASLWPQSNVLELPPRTVAVNAKCFPVAGTAAAAQAADLSGAAFGAAPELRILRRQPHASVVIVESPVGGGIFTVGIV